MSKIEMRRAGEQVTDCLYDGPRDAPASFLFAHGAGAPMDSDFMNAMAEAVAAHNICVTRFEFPYMADRRQGGKKRPPPKAEALSGYFEEVLDDLALPGAVYIGGKSMGGRIASLLADHLHGAGKAAGLICLGYPFHPPGKPERLRTAHLEVMTCPALICQGERDPFGTKDEVAGYALSSAIGLEWLPDGNHDLAPRKASGHTKDGNWRAAAEAIAGFMAENT